MKKLLYLLTSLLIIFALTALGDDNYHKCRSSNNGNRIPVSVAQIPNQEVDLGEYTVMGGGETFYLTSDNYATFEIQGKRNEHVNLDVSFSDNPSNFVKFKIYGKKNINAQWQLLTGTNNKVKLSSANNNHNGVGYYFVKVEAYKLEFLTLFARGVYHPKVTLSVSYDVFECDEEDECQHN